jgi:hypothetical protein
MSIAIGWTSRRWVRPPGTSSEAATASQRPIDGNPVDRADGGIDEVVAIVQQHGRIEHVAEDETSGRTGSIEQASTLLDGAR